jgi:RNA polymerase sigma-70 factor (ECF subfamily)
VRRRRPEDDPAFEDLFRAEYEPLVKALTLLCGDPQGAADAVQDAFLQAHRHWRRVAALEQPAGWVRHAAINRARNQIRGRARQLAALPKLAPHEDMADEPSTPDPDLVAALRRLPPQQRQAIVLYYLLDQPTADIASTLGVGEPTVRSHLRHGRQQLQTELTRSHP